jgi:polar amino acid transport system substrate-binding protein
MNRPLSLTAVLALAAATLLAACGSATPAGPVSPTGAHADLALRDQLPQAVRDRGVLRVGTEASYAPLESFGPDGRTIIGMEPDLGAEIGRVLGVRVEFVNTPFSDLIPKVTAGDLDLAISAMTDTPERTVTTDFVDYFMAGTSIIVQRGNPAGVTGIRDLCGKVVAAQTGTTQADLLQRTQANCGDTPIVINLYPTNTDTLLQLRTGRAAAVLNDFPAAVALVDDPRTTSSYQLSSTTQYEPGAYGIVVAKSQPGLRDAVQGACEKLLRGGVYAAVLSRWGVSSGAVEQITVNSGR